MNNIKLYSPAVLHYKGPQTFHQYPLWKFQTHIPSSYHKKLVDRPPQRDGHKKHEGLHEPTIWKYQEREFKISNNFANEGTKIEPDLDLRLRAWQKFHLVLLKNYHPQEKMFVLWKKKSTLHLFREFSMWVTNYAMKIDMWKLNKIFCNFFILKPPKMGKIFQQLSIIRNIKKLYI